MSASPISRRVERDPAFVWAERVCRQDSWRWDLNVDGETPLERSARHRAAAKDCLDCPAFALCLALPTDDLEGVVAGRVLGDGRKHLRTGPAVGRVVLDEVEWLARDGLTSTQIAARMNVTADAVLAACRRAGRRDLVATIKANRERKPA